MYNVWNINWQLKFPWQRFVTSLFNPARYVKSSWVASNAGRSKDRVMKPGFRRLWLSNRPETETNLYACFFIPLYSQRRLLSKPYCVACMYMYVFSWTYYLWEGPCTCEKNQWKNVSLQHGTKLLQHRRLSYSRHAVNDRDLSTQVNYKMHMNIRRMMGEHKHRHKRSKKLLKVRTFSRVFSRATFKLRNSSSSTDY